jgi:hypothetical protein
MTSQLDTDQSGTARRTMRQYLGPSIGLVDVPAPNSVLVVSAAGTFTIDPSITLVQVNVAGAVTLVLPSATLPTIAAIGAPARFAQSPITITDIGGNALAHPITIQAANVSENIMGFASIQIITNFGGFTLQPNSGGWTAASP